jgi:hypothetical protein
MVHLTSTPQLTPPASGPANRLARALVVGGAGLGAVLLVAALILWARYGTAVFFETIASGFAACF